MKKYLIALLALIFMTTITSAQDVGPSNKCLGMLNSTLQALEGINFDQAMSDGAKWRKFKDDARAQGKWDGVVQACCPSCGSADKKEKNRCQGCPCDLTNKCIWKCKCCWLGSC